MKAVQDILNSPVHRLVEQVREGSLTAVDIAKAFVDNARTGDPRIRAFVHFDDASIERQATIIDEKRKRGEPLGALAGIPVAIKDSICTIDAPTTCASRSLMHGSLAWRSPHESTAVARLRKADAIIFGKTNMDELSMGCSTTRSAFFPTRNPICEELVPGGSSGGSAAAVAARMVPLALGSDAGGGIRQPASFTHTVGIKPTYGRVSRFGLVGVASSMEQIGPLARSVQDAVRLLDVVAGRDERDATSMQASTSPLEPYCHQSMDGLRIGVAHEYEQDLPDDILVAVKQSLEALESAGCRLLPIRLPHTHLALSCYHACVAAEASSNLARFDGIRFGATDPGGVDVEQWRGCVRGRGLGWEVKRRVMLGTYLLSAQHREGLFEQARKARCLVAKDFDEAFSHVDAIATATSPMFPWPIEIGDESMHRADAHTVAAGLAGLPALSVPCGVISQVLPIGLQLIGPAWREDILIRIASRWEQLREPASFEREG